MATNNDDIKWLYGKLKAKGYNIGTEQEFQNSLSNEEDRKWYYEKAKGIGLNFGDMDDFDSLYAPQPIQPSTAQQQPAQKKDVPVSTTAQQASPMATGGAQMPGASVTAQPAMKQTTESHDNSGDGKDAFAGSEAEKRMQHYRDVIEEKGRVDDANRVAEMEFLKDATDFYTRVAEESKARKTARKESNDEYARMMKEQERRNAEGRKNADKERAHGVEWEDPDYRRELDAIEPEYSSAAKEETSGSRPQHGVESTPEGEALASRQHRGMMSEEEARQLSTEAYDGKTILAYDKDRKGADPVTGKGGYVDRTRYPAKARVMKDPEDIWSVRGKVDRTFTSKEPGGLPELSVTGISKAALKRRYDEYLRLHPELGDVAENSDKSRELMGSLRSEMIDEGRAIDEAFETWKAENPHKVRNMSEEELAGKREEIRADREFARRMGNLDLERDYIFRRYGERTAELTAALRDEFESKGLKPEGNRWMSALDAALRGDEELKALNVQSYNLGKAAERYEDWIADGKQGSIVNFAQGAGVALKEALMNPFGLAETQGSMIPLMHIKRKLIDDRGKEEDAKSGEGAGSSLSQDEVMALESYFLNQETQGRTKMSLARNSGEFTGALAEMAAEFGLNPASGLARRTLARMVAEVGKDGAMSLIRKSSRLARMVGYKGVEVSGARVAANLGKVTAAALGEGAVMSATTQGLKNFNAAAGRTVTEPVYDDDGNLVDVKGENAGSAAVKTGVSSALTNAAFVFPATFGTKVMKGFDNMAKTMHVPFGNPVDALVKMKSGEAMSILTADAVGRSDIDPTWSDFADPEKNGELIMGLLAAELTSGAMRGTADVANGTRLRHSREMAKAEMMAKAMRGAEAFNGPAGSGNRLGDWVAVVKAVYEGEESTIVDALARIARDGSMTSEQKEAALDYARSAYRYIGADRAYEAWRTQGEREAAAREAEEDWNVISDDTREMWEDEAYTRGYEAGQSAFAKHKPEEGRQNEKEAGVSEGSPEVTPKEATGEASGASPQHGDDISREMRDARDRIEDVFAGSEAEYYMAELEKDPWKVLEEHPEITPDQQEVVLDFINAKNAMAGMKDASEDVLNTKRAEVERSMEMRIHKKENMIIPVVKNTGEEVYLVKGHVAMTPDGKGVDKSNSDGIVYLYNPVSDKYETSAPQFIERVGESINPEEELAAAMSAIEEEHNAIFTENVVSHENIASSENAVSAEGAMEEPQEKNDSEANAVNEITAEEEPTPVGRGVFGNIYDSFKGKVRDAVSFLFKNKDGEAKGVFHREEIGEIGLIWGDDKKGLAHIISKHIVQNSDYNSVSELINVIDDVVNNGDITIQKGGNWRIDKDGHRVAIAKNDEGNFVITAYDNTRALGEKKRSEADATLFDQRVREEMDGTLVPSGFASAGKDNALSADKQGDGSESLALSRIPRDEAGNPVYEQTDPATAWEGLTESMGGDEAAASELANTMVSNLERRVAGLQKRKLKGQTSAELTQEINERKKAVSAVTQELEHWRAIADMPRKKAEETLAGSANGIPLPRHHGKESEISSEAARVEAERIVETERLETERIEAERLETERIEAERKAEEAWKSQRQRIDQKLRKTADVVRDCPEAMEILENTSPRNIWEAASWVLSTNKLIPRNDGVLKGFREMTGYKSGEQRKLVGLFAKAENGGKTLEKLAEDAMQSVCEEHGIPYDNREALNALLEVLQSCGTVGEIRNYIENNRIDQAMAYYERWRRESEWTPEEEAEYEDYQFRQEYGVSREEYENEYALWNEYKAEHLKEIDADFDVNEFYGNIADELADDRLLTNNGYGSRQREIAPAGDRGDGEIQGYGSAGAGTVSGRGGDVLPAQASVHAQGARTDGEGSGVYEENGDGGIVPPSAVSAESSRGDVLGTSGLSEGLGTSGSRPQHSKEATGQTPEGAAKEPTEAQKAAGNYKMEHRRVDGYNISIENTKGSVRRGTGADGKPWETVMQNDYGYIRGTEGVDGDHIDVFLSDTPEEGDVFVIDQVNEDGSFDEHKVMYGFPSEKAARDAYLSNYDAGWTGLGAITHVSKDEFKKWIQSSTRKTKPFAEYKSVKAITEDVDQTPTNVDTEGMVVDGEGKALTLYHGTPNDVGALSDLEAGHLRKGADEPARFNGDGVSFTPHRDVAEDYASLGNGSNGKVFEANVILKNPYYTIGVANFTPEEAAEFTASLKAKGHDGIINYASQFTREMGAEPNEVIVFDISSAVPTTARSKFDRTVPATPEAQRSAISRIIDFAKVVRNRVERAVVGGITKRQAKDFADNGIDVDETWVHSFESSAVAHNQKHHGNDATEASRGQIAISIEDYARIPDILENYDRVSKSNNKTKGTENEVIIYEKEFEDGYVYYLEEKRDNRKSLSFHTMYKKKKGTDSSDGFAVNLTAPITPLATSDNLSSNSGGKDNALSADKQAIEGESFESEYGEGVVNAFDRYIASKNEEGFEDKESEIVACEKLLDSLKERVEGMGDEELAAVERDIDSLVERESATDDGRAWLVSDFAHWVSRYAGLEKRRLEIERQRTLDNAVVTAQELTSAVPRKTNVRIDRFVDKRENSRLGGVYHDASRGMAVASDSRMLVMSAKDYNPENAGKVIAADGVKDVKYPDVARVIPSEDYCIARDAVDFGLLEGMAEDAMRRGKSEAVADRSPQIAVRSVNNEYAIVDALVLRDFARGARHVGATEVGMYRSGETSWLVANGKDGLSLMIGKLYEPEKTLYKVSLGEGSGEEHKGVSGTLEMAEEVAAGYGAARESQDAWFRGESVARQMNLFDFDFSKDAGLSADGSTRGNTSLGSRLGTEKKEIEATREIKAPKRVKSNLFDFDFSDESKPESADLYKGEDNQGNPIDREGRLIVEDVKNLNEISDNDFIEPSRTVGLPQIPQNVTDAIGANGRKTIIKKSIFKKNKDTHGELTPADSRDILNRALYNPNLVGTNQPIRRPDYKVAIQTGDKNAVVVLDVYSGKDNVEIVGWRKVDAKGLEKMKRQAEREGGQFLILSPKEGSAAALSALPSDVSSAGKDNALSADKQAIEEKNLKRSEPKRQMTIEDFGEKIAGARKDILRDLSRNLGNVNVESLVKLSLSKAIKRPDFGKMVERGAMTEDEAMTAEAMWQEVYSSRKPAATSSRKRAIVEWAENTERKIRRLEDFINSDSERRHEIMEGLSSESFPDQEREALNFRYIQNLNPTKKFDVPLFTPSAAWVNRRVMEAAGMRPGSSMKIEFSIHPNMTYQYYELCDASGHRVMGFPSTRDLESAVDMVTLATRMHNGDLDVEYPSRFFNAKGRNAIFEPTGEFEVGWLKGHLYENEICPDEEIANKKAESLNARGVLARVYPVKRHAGYEDYAVRFKNPISGEEIVLEDSYPDRETALQMIEDDPLALSQKVNSIFAERQNDKKAAKDHFFVTVVYEDHKLSHAVCRNNIGGKMSPWARSVVKKFESRADAAAWLKENRDRLESEYTEMMKRKRSFVYFEQGEGSRKGEDYRKGVNVTPEQFSDTFGFRGVQFGNWTNDADRQAALNEAYDALRDLAGVLGLDNRALSLDGELGLAFGSRGSGSANAHYESGEVVINLTKTRGAGSLAHEWWHALDNYLMRKAGVANGYATEHLSGKSKIRSEIAAAITGLVKAVGGSDYSKRSLANGDYWGRIIEQTARLFGEWVVMKQEASENRNYFLSRGIVPSIVDEYRAMTYADYKGSCRDSGEVPVSMEEWKTRRESLGTFPYPTSEEVKELSAPMERVFEALRKGGDGGLAVTEIAMEPAIGYSQGSLFEKPRMRARQLSLFDNGFENMELPDEATVKVDAAVDEYSEALAEIFKYPEDAVPEDVLDQMWDKRDSLMKTLNDYFRSLGNNEKEAAERTREMLVTLQAQVSVAALRKGREAEEEIPLPRHHGKVETANKKDNARMVAKESEVVKRETAGGDLLSYRHSGLLRELREGEFSLMERTFSETGEFHFSGDSKIESADDVAYMLRNLEMKSVEHSFAVLTKDGVPTVVHLGMGTFNVSPVNLVAVKAADNALGGADRIWFVHNHPSGNLGNSPQDMSLHRALKDMFGDRLEPSIILDTLRGQYAEFGETGNTDRLRPSRSRNGEEEVRVYQFDRAVYSKDYDFSKLSKIGASGDVAAFLSGYRLGEGEKAGVLIINQMNQIVGNLPCSHSIDSPEGVDAIVNYAIHGGGTSVIVYGNDAMSRGKLARLGEGIGARSGRSIRLLDVIIKNGNDFTSANDEGIMEPEVGYGGTSGLRPQHSEKTNVRFRDGDKEDSRKARIERLRKSKAVEITGNEIEYSSDIKQFKKNAIEYGKKLQGEYINEDRGKVIQLQRGRRNGGLKEVLQHDLHQVAHIQSVAAIPDIIRKSTYIKTEPNYDMEKNPEVRGYEHYVCGLKIGGEDYTVHSIVAEDKAGNRYYDHKLSHIEKGKLLDFIEAKQPIDRILTPMSGTKPTIRSERKIKELISLLQVEDDETSKTNEGVSQRVLSLMKSEHLTSVTDGATLSGDAKLPKFFEYPKSENYPDIRLREGEAIISGTDTKEKEDRVNELSDKLGVPVRIITTPEDINNLPSVRQRRSKGYWSSRDGVVVILPNNRDVADVENTFVHEVVGHKGLRAMIGKERFDEFLGEVYDHSSDPIRRVIDRMTDDMVNAEVERLRARKAEARDRAGEDVNANYYADMAGARLEAEARRADFRREATEEYMADLGGRIGNEGFEKMSLEELTLWGKIKAKVQQFLDRFLQGLQIAKNIRLTDKDLAYILYKSWKNMRERGASGSRSQHGGIFAEAEDAVMRRCTGWDEAMLSESAKIEDANNRFNRQLQRWESGTMESNEVIDAGKPMGVMKHFMPDETLILRQKVLSKSRKKHGLSGEDMRGLPGALAHPIFVFQSNQKTVSVLTELKSSTGQNLFVAVEVGVNKQLGHRTLEVNDILTVHGREIENIVLPIVENNSLIWVDKEKGLEWLSSAKSNSQAIASQTLEDATKIIKSFENPKFEGDEDVRFRDGDLGLEETITKMKAEALSSASASSQEKRDAMRAIGGNLNHLRQAMARQRKYDVATVRSVSDLARVLMDENLLDDLSRYEMKRILGVIDNVVGKQDVGQYVQKVMDIMIDNQLRMGANAFGRLLSVRGKRVDARGIEVQGDLDPEGQGIAQVVRRSTSLPKDDIDNKIAEAGNRMGSPDKAIADEAAIEYAGLQIARQYVEDITESKAEEKDLRDSLKPAKEEKAAGLMSDDAYSQYVESVNDAIRQNRLERVESFHSLSEQLGGVLSESVERAKAWREAEKQRVSDIHHNANSDMEGRPTDEHHKDNRVEKIVNNDMVRFLFAPLATFDQMLRMFGNKNTRGEGYLWNRYMRGWVKATEKEYTGYRDALKILDAKVREIFSSPSGSAQLKRPGNLKRWGDLFSLDRKLPKASVRFLDGGEMKDHELTQGNLLYIHMADKMSDGRMKLRRMGITQRDVEDIKNFLDPRFIQLADWMQEEFLVDKRNEYNEVHKRMFGASMAAIENYFPLKILSNARVETVDVAEDTADTALPATSTGSIIKRRRNNLALDVTGANAFSVILDHLQQMERWAAFAEFNRDLNTLLSYKRFRNQVMNMSSVYGGGKTLWKNFRNVCSMAAGAYRLPIAALDKAAVNIAKGVTAAKVSFRMFTALKQFLSMPAYVSDANPIYLAANIANPAGAWKWAMENLPLFEKRWSSRMSGDPRLLKSEMDWKMWRSRVVEIASRVGMSPNAFVDALTVAIGARSMYQTKLAKYKRLGYDEHVAEERAKQDATILFNQTQQSSESAFLSTMQVDRSWLSVLFTVFRNSSMSYTRQLYDSMRNIKRRFKPGYKVLSEEFMAKQMMRDGIDPDKADRNARQEYRQGIIRDMVRVGIFGYVLQFAWNLGAYLPYLILGDDEEEKDDMWNDVMAHSSFGSIEGLTGGDVYSNILNAMAKGESVTPWIASKDMPLASDIESIWTKWNTDEVSAMNDAINLLVQSAVGVNPQSLTDAVVAVMDYSGDDAQTSRECALLIARVINCPPSQLDKVYFDELDATGEEASQMTPYEIAERYARYKVRRGAPLTGWAYGSKKREKIMDRYRKKINTLAKEKIGNLTDKAVSDRIPGWQDEYKATQERLKQVRAIRESDENRYYELLDDLEVSPEYERYEIIRDYKRDINALTKEWLRAKTPAQLDSCAKAIIERKREMVTELVDTQQ